MGKSQTIRCEYKDCSDSSGRKLGCFIKYQSFAKDVKEYKFDDKTWMGSEVLQHVCVLNCEMPKIPKNFPWNMFYNLSTLDLQSSQLKTISRVDFRELRSLSEINLDNNKIEHLPGDAFCDLTKLKKLSIAYNKINFIEASFISTLEKLNFLDLRGNSFWRGTNCKIDLFFDQSIASGSLIKAVKNEILTKSRLLDENYAKFEKTRKISKETGRMYQKDIPDFSLIVNDKSFKVHKSLLIAKSTVLAIMVTDNPEANSLKLDHIPPGIFENLLNFLYYDTLPQDGATFKDIFIAADRLNIKKLKNYTGVKLIDQVNAENAFEMLNLANKCDHEELRSKAFGRIKEMFPGRELKDEIAKDEENIQKLYELKKKQDELERELDLVFSLTLNKYLKN